MENSNLPTTITVDIQSKHITSTVDTSHLANDLAKFIKENRLCHNIQGKEYVNVEGWLYAGSRLGILPVVESCDRLPSDEATEIKYQAKTRLLDLRTSQIIGTGFAVCSNKEQSKKYYQEYAIASMAQTRSIGKAYRNILAWIIRAAGYEPTPAEEMDQVINTPSGRMDTSTGEIVEPKAANKPTKGEIKDQTQQAIKNAGSMPVKTAETVATNPITINQKTQILLLLNNSVITKEERERMVAKINTFDTERAEQSIAKLKKVIKERTATTPTAAEEPASEKQIDFIRKLIKSHVFSDSERTKAEELIANGLSKKEATTWVDYYQNEMNTRKEYEASKTA